MPRFKTFRLLHFVCLIASYGTLVTLVLKCAIMYDISSQDTSNLGTAKKDSVRLYRSQLEEIYLREKIPQKRTVSNCPTLYIAREDFPTLSESFGLTQSRPQTILAVNMSSPATQGINCINSKTSPLFVVCPHPPEKDRFISSQIMKEGTWEQHTLKLFKTAILLYPRSAVIDFGSHVGMYSLYGAMLGAHIIAVEPVWTSVVRLHTAAVKNNIRKIITILPHSVTNERAWIKLKYRPGNLGGTSLEPIAGDVANVINTSRTLDIGSSITLDHITQFVNETAVIIKMDIEGRECQAILGGKKFLKRHKVPYIFMEWSAMFRSRHLFRSPCRWKHVKDMLDWLTANSYLPHASKSGNLLDPSRFDNWRVGAIYWRRRTAPLLHPYS